MNKPSPFILQDLNQAIKDTPQVKKGELFLKVLHKHGFECFFSDYKKILETDDPQIIDNLIETCLKEMDDSYIHFMLEAFKMEINSELKNVTKQLENIIKYMKSVNYEKITEIEHDMNIINQLKQKYK
jgi:hypothetical protein